MENYRYMGLWYAIPLPQRWITRNPTDLKSCLFAGGGNVYKKTFDLWDEIIISKFPISMRADTYFPIITSSDWRHKKDAEQVTGSNGKLMFSIHHLTRIHADQY